MNNAINEHAFSLATAAAAKPGSITAVAAEIGYTRGAVSQYLSRSYAASPAKMEAAILSRYDIYPCPHTGQQISGPDCKRRATSPRPFGGRAKEAHWHACQSCQHNQNRSQPQGEKS